MKSKIRWALYILKNWREWLKGIWLAIRCKNNCGYPHTQDDGGWRCGLIKPDLPTIEMDPDPIP